MCVFQEKFSFFILWLDLNKYLYILSRRLYTGRTKLIFDWVIKNYDSLLKTSKNDHI